MFSVTIPSVMYLLLRVGSFKRKVFFLVFEKRVLKTEQTFLKMAFSKISLLGFAKFQHLGAEKPRKKMNLMCSKMLRETLERET